jgi:hypothetical protein
MPQPQTRTPSLPNRLRDFYRHQSFEQLVQEQGIQPATRLSDYQGGWPEDQLEDGFEEAVIEWRTAAP